MPTISSKKVGIRVKILNTSEDKKIFLYALLNPPSANSSLKKAQSNYKKFIEANTTKKPF